MKPAEAKRVATTLIMQEEVFDRSYTSILAGLKHTEKKFLNNLRLIHSESSWERRKEDQNLQKSLLAIVMVIQKLKQNIQDEKYIEKHDIEHFKNHLTSIEKNLSSFKSLVTKQLEALQLNEQELQQSIDSIMQRALESTANSSRSDSSPITSMQLQAQAKVDTHISEQLHPDIQEFQLFVQNRGGHTGGWETNDHLLFTRLLQKYRGSNQMTIALLDLMPDKTAEEIAEHESWYHDYLTLKQAHRRAIQEWRDEQRAKHCLEDKSPTSEELSVLKKSPEKNKDRDPKIKEKIKLWKQMQEEKRKEILQQQQQKEREEREQWKKKVEYFEQQRKLIAQKRTEQREAQAKSQPETGEMQHLLEVQQRVKQARIPLKEFWQQDRQFIQRRMARLKQRNTSVSPTRSSSRSSSHSRVQVERDPARLLQSTAVWRARTRRSLSEDNRGSTSYHGPLYIADIPHLGVPKWREGLI